jgi:CheY-like chemotaxis protein
MIIDSSNQKVDILLEHKQCTAFHGAGYAVAIYLNSKAKNLPPISFQIMLKDLNGNHEEDQMDYHTTQVCCIVRAEAGELIELLPSSINGLIQTTTGHTDATSLLIKDSMSAFDADLINRLIGSLAEAKHIADIDNELFNQRLVNLGALKNYGGSTDLVLITKYIQSFSTDKQKQDIKLHEMFGVAFNFINDQANWTAITSLANYILNSNNNIISSEEIALLIELSRVTNDKPAAILFVDDEVNVLNALRRLFHDERYSTYFAASGAEGLKILQEHAVDLIISDMRMPEMNGAEFLTQVVMQWPDTIRILLTGYSDIQSTIDAVNKGRIYYYCSKPWNDEDLKLLVRNALEQKTAERKNSQDNSLGKYSSA